MTLYFKINKYNRIILIDENDQLKDLQMIRTKFEIKKSSKNKDFIYPVTYDFLKERDNLSFEKIINEYYFSTFGK